MALWGNKDSKTATGTVSITTAGAVTGTSTLFTTQAKTGNYITVGSSEYQIVTITSDTVAKVVMGKNNGHGLVTTQTGASYALSEKPVSVAHSSSDSVGRSGDSTKVFGIDLTESRVAGNRAKGLKVPGWSRYTTYTDAQGNVRNKSEVLVAMSSLETAAVMGDAADDAVVADA
jgi:hypothetical protein